METFDPREIGGLWAILAAFGKNWQLHPDLGTWPNQMCGSHVTIIFNGLIRAVNTGSPAFL
jgi:hypothetical protein